jgi:uncharacterized protein DUF1569
MAFDAALADHHNAVEQVTATARGVPGGVWTTPREQGKWSPAQVVEHLALSYEFNSDVLNGTAGRGLPRFLRPLLRRLVLDSTLKAGRFTRKGKAPSRFQPSSAAGTQAEGIARFAAKAETFEAQIRVERPDTIDHPYFGRIAATDFLKLQAIHTRHHGAQLPALQAAGTST